ncbi:DUF4384 domain-containing protein [Novosphingobium sp. NBM11]|uniref:hypothetical protein n=1 Tax=Novosphingobium sp. NBM11 TaxID=2596914 RepID=UPI0018923047|nr:hypothetical protein [Novosphingobium sp. NBM11]MBF5089080.1 DUF4384 domain-containing protein [Novosphingobium sp. NBM11]
MGETGSPEHGRRLGRRPGAYGKIDLRAHLDIVADYFPDKAAAQSIDGLCRAMRPYLGILSEPPNVVAVTGGRKPLTRKFLRALHCAHALNEFGLPSEIWLRPEASFRELLESLFLTDPRAALRRLVGAESWATLRTSQILGAGAPVATKGPFVHVGDRIQIALRLPRTGYVTIINADPSADSALYYWLNPWLETPHEEIVAGDYLLPQEEPFLPIGPPDNVVSCLIAIVADVPLTLDWSRPSTRCCPPVDLARMRVLAARTLALPASARAVAIIDYTVRPGRSVPA